MKLGWAKNARFMLSAVVTASILGVPALASATARFGTYCQQDYENNWRPEAVETWNRCAGFNNKLDDTDTKVFYFDLSNKKYYLEASGDHQADNKSADDVDLLFINTHGGAWTSPMTSVLTMWNQNTRAYTKDMRLGDSATWGGGLAILAAYACETLKNSDGNLWSRLGPMFRGGLKIALGSHDTLVGSAQTNMCGAYFAANLQSGQTFKRAWLDALSHDWWEAQDIAVTATGANASDCASRRDNMKWQNYGGYGFLRDNAIGYVCWTTWDDL
jgi:hypothetical protein